MFFFTNSDILQTLLHVTSYLIGFEILIYCHTHLLHGKVVVHTFSLNHLGTFPTQFCHKSVHLNHSLRIKRSEQGYLSPIVILALIND